MLGVFKAEQIQKPVENDWLEEHSG